MTSEKPTRVGLREFYNGIKKSEDAEAFQNYDEFIEFLKSEKGQKCIQEDNVIFFDDSYKYKK